MSLVVVTAGKGSPGVTTLAIALAAVWPRSALLAECDPAGGDLPYLLPAADGRALTATRGVVSLAASSRRQELPPVDEHIQPAAGGLPVLVGAASRAQSAALAASWARVTETLRLNAPSDVIADAGRFDGDAAARLLIGAAAMTVVMCRPSVASVAHAREVLMSLGRGGDGSRPPDASVGVVVVGDQPDVREVSHALAPHAPSFVTGVADDPAAARGLCGQWSRRLDRSRLVVSVRLLARQVDRATAIGRSVSAPPVIPTAPVAEPGRLEVWG